MSGEAAEWEEEEEKTRGRVFTGLGSPIQEAAATLAAERKKNERKLQKRKTRLRWR